MSHPISLTIILVAALSVTAQAQTTLPSSNPVASQGEVAGQGATLKDGLRLQGGRVMLTEQGRTNPLSQDMTLINGTKISTTGAVTMTNGTTATLQEGDVLSLSGRLTTAAMKAEQTNQMTMASQGKLKAKRK